MEIRLRLSFRWDLFLLTTGSPDSDMNAGGQLGMFCSRDFCVYFDLQHPVHNILLLLLFHNGQFP